MSKNKHNSQNNTPLYVDGNRELTDV